MNNLVGKAVKEAVYETVYTVGGEQKQVVKSILFEDGTRIANGEVIPARSVIDKLMDGEVVTLELSYFSNGKPRQRTRSVILWHSVLKVEDTGKIKCLFYDIFTASHNGQSIDLDELRRRVAIKETKRLEPWAKPAKPDISKEWWVIADHGVPELEDGKPYEYHWRWSGDLGCVRYGNSFHVEDGRLQDLDGDLVIRIKESN